MGAITFSEFTTWGATSYNGTKQPRFTVKDDVTFVKGSHTLKTGFTYDRQQAKRFRPAGLRRPGGLRFQDDGVPGGDQLCHGRRQLVRVVPCWLGEHRPDRKLSGTSSRSIRTTGSTHRTTGA
jgi:hypothetical protein